MLKRKQCLEWDVEKNQEMSRYIVAVLLLAVVSHADKKRDWRTFHRQKRTNVRNEWNESINKEPIMSRYIIAIMVLLSAAILIAAEPENNCPKNQTWALCGTLCQRTCSDPRFRLCGHPCSESTSACACNKGYVRNENTNLCVLVQDC